MLSFIARRLLALIPVLWVVSLVVFLILRLAPGDPAAVIAGNNATTQDIAKIRAELGLERSVPEQYVIWLGRVVQGDLGHSYYLNKPVSALIGERVGTTLSLALGASVLAVLLAVPLGTLAAWRMGILRSFGRRHPISWRTLAAGAMAACLPFIGVLLTLALVPADDGVAASPFSALTPGTTAGNNTYDTRVRGLVAMLIAPYLRKFGQYTVPDFLSARYSGANGSHTVRLIAVLATVIISFTYVVAQIYGVGLITTRLTGIAFEWGIFLGLGGILVCSFLGGMRAVTWTQVAQYIILIIAYMTPVVWLGIKHTGSPIPQVAYGVTLQKVGDLEKKIGQAF